MASAPTVLNTSWSLLITGISASIACQDQFAATKNRSNDQKFTAAATTAATANSTVLFFFFF